MAVNKSGKGSPPNFSDDSDFGRSLNRIVEESGRDSSSSAALKRLAKQGHQRRRAIEATAESAARVAEDEGKDPNEAREAVNGNPRLQQEIYKAKQFHARVRSHEELKRERLNTQAVNIVGRDFSPSSVNSYVAQSINTPEMQASGMASAQKFSFADLTGQRKDIMQQMNTVRSRATEAAGQLVQSGGTNSGAAQTIQRSEKEFADLKTKLTQNQAGLTELKREGLDPQSRFSALTKKSGVAANVLQGKEVEDAIRNKEGLGALSAKDLRAKEIEASAKVAKAMDDLRASLGKGDKVVEEFTSAAEKATEDLDNVHAFQKAGGGKGEGGGNGQAYLSILAQVATLAANTIHTMAVQQPMQVQANIAGYANLENEKYDTWKAAVGGDMTSRLNLGMMDDTKDWSRDLALREGWGVLGARGVGAAAGIAGAVVEGTDIAAGTVGKKTVGEFLGTSGDTIKDFAGVIQGGGESTAMGLITAKDALQHISTSQVEIAANQQGRATANAINHVSGYQLQQYHDYATSLTHAAGNLGTGANAFMDSTNSAAFMGRMDSLGMGTTEFSKLAAQGSANISGFSGENVLSAKKLENLGFGSAADNLQRQGMLQGSQNPIASSERIVEQGMSKGLTNSRALNAIAEHTGQLVESVVKGGSSFGDADAISKMLFGMTNQNIANEGIRADVAVQTFKSLDESTTGRGAGWTDRVAVARLQKDLGLNWENAQSLQGVGAGTWKGWQASIAKNPGAKSQIQSELFDRGIDVSQNEAFQKNPAEWLKTLGKDKALNAVEARGGFAFGANKNFAEAMKWVGNDAKRAAQYSGQDTDQTGMPENVKQQVLALNRTANNNGLNPVSLKMGIMQMQGAGGDAVNNYTLPDGTKAFLGKEEANRGNQEQTRAAQVGQGAAAGGAGRSGAESLGGLTVGGRKIQDAAKESEFTNAAAENAASFGASAKKLDYAGDKLIEAARLLAASAGMNKRDPNADKEIKELKETMEKPLDVFNTDKARVDGGT